MAVTAVLVVISPVLIVVGARSEPAGGSTARVSAEVMGMSGMMAVPAAPVVSALVGFEDPGGEGVARNRSNPASDPSPLCRPVWLRPGPDARLSLSDHGELGYRHSQRVIDRSGEVNILCAHPECWIGRAAL